MGVVIYSCDLMVLLLSEGGRRNLLFRRRSLYGWFSWVGFSSKHDHAVQHGKNDVRNVSYNDFKNEALWGCPNFMRKWVSNLCPNF